MTSMIARMDSRFQASMRRRPELSRQAPDLPRPAPEPPRVSEPMNRVEPPRMEPRKELKGKTPSMSPVIEEEKLKNGGIIEMRNAAMEREMELRRLQDLRASYRKTSVENKEAAKSMMTAYDTDVFELKNLFETLTSQMLKIREMDNQIQKLVQKDMCAWRKEVSAAVDFNLLWIYYLQDLRGVKRSEDFSRKENTALVVNALDDLGRASNGFRSYM